MATGFLQRFRNIGVVFRTRFKRKDGKKYLCDVNQVAKVKMEREKSPTSKEGLAER